MLRSRTTFQLFASSFLLRKITRKAEELRDLANDPHRAYEPDCNQ